MGKKSEGLKITLTVEDRLVLMSVLPKQGDILNMRTVRHLQEQLGFSDAEQQALKFDRLEAGGLVWVKKAAKDIEMEFSPVGLTLIVTSFESLDKAKKLELGHVATYEKFMKE